MCKTRSSTVKELFIVQSRKRGLCTNNRFCTKNTDSAQIFKNNRRRDDFILSAEQLILNSQKNELWFYPKSRLKPYFRVKTEFMFKLCQDPLLLMFSFIESKSVIITKVEKPITL
jgi:hypothetical protein